MKHILIYGASSVHGIGSTNGGWADKIKISLHQDMYSPNGPGEICEVYELGVPGTTLQDILARLSSELQARVRTPASADTYIIFSAGTNDSKAVDGPENHLFTPDDFAASVHAFIHLAKDYSTHILAVGISPVEEAKVSPKHNPLTGESSYFTNQRLKVFEEAFQRTCEEEDVPFVPIFGQVPHDWTEQYLFRDGIHPNDAGHEWICSQVEPKVRELLGPLHD